MKIKYRPEIDGLRAISVFLIIIYHANLSINGIKLFPGGFIGVDIFFVISGYLISSILLREKQTTGQINLLNFYNRRARRLIPCLSVVSIATIFFSLIYIVPYISLDTIKSIFSANFFIANFYFFFTGQAYGEPSSLLKPFLHTWSLGVEEQFYIIFPILLIFLFKVFKNNILNFFVLIFFISFFSSNFISNTNVSLSFYMIFSRAWEIIFGVIIGLRNFDSLKIKPIYSSLIALLGLLLIFFSCVFFSNSTIHPSFISVLPVIGCGLIIIFCDKEKIINALLSSKILVFFGLISYSLYLWHYPIFAFSRITDLHGNKDFFKILIVVFLFLISFLSYKFIEKPFRDQNKINNKLFINILVFYLFFLSFVTFLTIKKDGNFFNLPQILSESHSKSFTKVSQNNSLCHDREEDFCSFGIEKNSKKIILIGDSHANTLLLDLKNRSLEEKISVSSTSFSGFTYLPDFILIDKRNNKIIHDNYKHKKIKSLLDNNKNSYVVYFARFPLYLSEKEFFLNPLDDNGEYHLKIIHKQNKLNLEQGIISTLNEISENHKLIIIYPFPEAGFDVPSRFYSNYFKISNKLKKDQIYEKDYLYIDHDIVKDRLKISYKLLDRVVGKNIFKIYPKDLICNLQRDNKCLLHDDKSIFYRDSNHPGYSITKKINNEILQIIKNNH